MGEEAVKKFLMKAAAACAVFGAVFCILGFMLGGKPTGVQLSWENGRPRVEYKSAGLDELLVGEAPLFSAGRGGENTSGKEQSAQGGSVTFTEELHSMDIELGGVQLYLKTGDSWNVTVENTKKYRAYAEAGVLHVSCFEDDLLETAAVFTVTYPKDALLREVDIQLGAGSLEAESFVCSELELEVGAGDAVLQNVEVDRSCEITVGIGSVELNGSLLGETGIECGMGNVSCRLYGVEDYDYEVDCGMGSVRLDDREYSGIAVEDSRRTGAAVRYEIECGMGSVEIIHAG